MTFEQFIAKYNGKYVDFDKRYGYQCVDLMRQYCEEVLNISGYTLPPVTYAKQLFTNFPNAGTTRFTKIYNKPTNSPKRGDIVIWGYYPFVTGWAGHVAICSNAWITGLITFDQNWGNPNFCRYVNHSYRGVMGWLTPKK